MEQHVASDMERCWTLCRRGESHAALSEGIRLRDLAIEHAWPETAALASGMIGWFCFQLGEVEIGIEHAYAAKNFWAERQNSEREAWTGAVYAWSLLEAGLTEEAADEAVKALSLAEQTGHAVTISWAVNVLGVIFWACKQLDRAQVLCQRAVDIARSQGDETLLGWWLINLAGVYSEIGYREKAEGHPASGGDSLRHALNVNQEALAIARRIGDDWSLRVALANSAEYFMAIGELAEAAAAIDAWDALPGSGGSRNAAHFLYTKGQLLTKQGRLTEALSVCANALVLAQTKRHVESEAYALRYISDIYEAMGRFDTALGYFKRFYEAQSRIAAEKTQRRARFAEIHYETERFRRLAETASERADQMAITTMLDPLTGLGNRRRLDKAFDDVRSGGRRFAIAVIDLDYFKMINDMYSHAIGDDVLKRVASTLQAALRGSDIVVRLGGEEFVVVMHDVDIEAATALCHHLNAAVASAAWGEIAPGLCVTASIGVAVGDEGKHDPSILLELADRRLYMAKSAGRNRTVGASSQPDHQEAPELLRLVDPQVLGLRGVAAAGRAVDAKAPHLQSA